MTALMKRVKLVNATTVAFRQLFLGDSSDLRPFLPKSYLRLVDNQSTGGATINAATFSLRYSNVERDVSTDTEPPHEPSTEYGLGLIKYWGSPFRQGGETLAFTTRASGIGTAIAQAVGKDVAPNQALLSSKGKDVTSKDWYDIDDRFNLIDSTHQIFAGAEVGADLRDVASISHLIGISPYLGIGLDDIWAGHKRRNVYGAGGVAFDLHVAKYSIYLGIWRELHYNNTYNSWKESRGMIGFRVMSIDMDRIHR